MDTGRRRLAATVAAVALAALALRTVALGDRIFHWDEARVGYWILQYQATGEWSYRAIVHGPFLFHVNEFLFGVLGDSDAVARLPVAVVGALLPATAWLFRTRLSDGEVAALAGLFALNPALVYYSRFMRSDVLVAAFSVAAVGFVVRALDTDRDWYLVAAGVAMALAFTTKENALVYLGMFAGATALLFDQRILTAETRGETWGSAARTEIARVVAGVRRRRRAVAGSVAAFVAVVAFFYAPRPEFYDAFTNPGQLPSVLGAGTLGAWQEFWGTWGIGGVGRQHSYVDYLTQALKTMVATSLVVSAVSVVGFVAERYAADEPRDLVMFAAYWGVASVVVYPIITDIPGHWSTLHALVPLAIPAAVGVGLVLGRAKRSLAADDPVGVGLAALVLFSLVAQMGVVAYETSFLMPQEPENEFVQYGQPQSEMRETLVAIESVAEANEDGTDVAFFGSHFYVGQEYDGSDPGSVAGTDWFNRFPLNWYLERADASVDSTLDARDITTCSDSLPDREFAGCDAPVVVTRAKHYPELAPALAGRGYASWTYELTSTNTVFVVLVDTDAPGYASS
jgi:uncharacterized protein (TIGR03663 family)